MLLAAEQVSKVYQTIRMSIWPNAISKSQELKLFDNAKGTQWYYIVTRCKGTCLFGADPGITYIVIIFCCELEKNIFPLKL